MDRTDEKVIIGFEYIAHKLNNPSEITQNRIIDMLPDLPRNINISNLPAENLTLVKR